MSDQHILQTITQLVHDEHGLRQQVARGELSVDDEHGRLAELARSLDQCWDLLRQRRARREHAQDAGDAAVRPTQQVQGHQQ
jgi:hypothetical protein